MYPRCMRWSSRNKTIMISIFDWLASPQAEAGLTREACRAVL